MGLTLGIVAAPCIGPFVLGLLTWVAGIGNLWFGFLVFFTLSLGLGLPLFILALFSGQLQRLPRAGGWMNWVRGLMGWVLVGMAAYFIRPLLPETLKVFLPVAVAFGVDPVHLGIVICFNITVGLLSPPLGGVILIISTVTGANYWQLIKATFPFFVVEVALLAALVAFPAISLALPTWLGLMP